MRKPKQTGSVPPAIDQAVAKVGKGYRITGQNGVDAVVIDNFGEVLDAAMQIESERLKPRHRKEA